MEKQSLTTDAKLRIVLIHFGIILCLYFSSLFVSTKVTGPAFVPSEFFSRYFDTGFVINLALFYLCYWVLVNEISPFRKIRVALKMAALFVGFISVGLLFDRWHLQQITADFSASFLPYAVVTNAVVKLYFLAAALFTYSLVNLMLKQRYYSQLRLVTLEAELSLLKSQMNPHFLFNTLNAIYASAYQFGDLKTANGIGQIAALMRYALHKNHQASVRLDDEIDYIDQYIGLQQFRYQDQLEVDFSRVDIDEAAMIPPMLLMPLVENAFKYGVYSGEDNQITMRLGISNHRLQFDISNNDHSPLVKRSPKFAASGLGLAQLEQRLALLFNDRCTLTRQTSDGRYHTKLEIPCS